MYTREFRNPVWRKSTRSFANNECVEVARLTDREVGLRDSKPGAGGENPVLRTDTSTWEGLTAQVKSGFLGT